MATTLADIKFEVVPPVVVEMPEPPTDLVGPDGQPIPQVPQVQAPIDPNILNVRYYTEGEDAKEIVLAIRRTATLTEEDQLTQQIPAQFFIPDWGV